jgi:large subunit ribosomal protein L29
MSNGLVAQLRVSTEEELHFKLAEAKEELFNLRFQSATGQLETHGRLRAVRKEIARIYTVMRERELGIITLVEESDELDDGQLDDGQLDDPQLDDGAGTDSDVAEEASK